MSADPLRDSLVTALGAQYDIGRLLGRGGMGAVYHGRERALEREVAIKVLPPEGAAIGDGRERFLREARLAAQLSHSNIVPLYTFGETPAVTFFIMGFVNGESLADKLRREGRIAPEVAKEILAQLADALHYAHEKGIVHRDIKPDNVLIERGSGRAMLADFGIARGEASASLTQTGIIVGTPTYMSPEQASGARTLDGRSDLYSLGVMGYEMLSGRPPFAGLLAQEVLAQHVTRMPAPLATLVPDAPDDLLQMIAGCLEKDPARRPKDGHAMREGLRRGDSDDIEDLPPRLRTLRGMVPQYALCAAFLVPVLTAIQMRWGLGSEMGQDWMTLVWGVTVASPIGSAIVVLFARRGGHSWREIRRLALMTPRWWNFPWPASWHAGDDPTRRLPVGFQRARRVVQLSTSVSILAVMEMAAVLIGSPDPHNAPYRMWLLLGVVASAVTIYGGLAAAIFLGRRMGLSADHSAKLLTTPSRSRYWLRPEAQAILSPLHAGTRLPGEPQSPAELALSIAQLAGDVEAADPRLASESRNAAGEAVAEIEALDSSIASLALEADPAELARLEARLAALAPASEMRPLLLDQLQLLRTLAERRAALIDRRQRVEEMLRTLWLQLASLRAARELEPSQREEITGRIRAICSGIDAHVRAEHDVRTLLTQRAPSDTPA
ncbi:MAG: hypothetical protein JWO05_297 [Gemmatimonadetes bacterium]|nr:hypothetical protein [Gemmatimonadota bacterium]